MRHIALAGKGSSGKSTIAVFLVEAIKRRPTVTHRLLVVDADPHGTLTRLLGLAPRATLGELRSRYERALLTGAGLPADETRTSFAEATMGREALLRADGFDFLSLGHWEMPGSNCVPNRILERALATLAYDYDTVLTDNEAGIEHIGRFATVPLDRLILVAQPDPLYFDVARQVLAHAREVGREVRETRLVINRVQPGDEAFAREAAQRLHLVPTLLPESTGLRVLSQAGCSPLDLPATNVWRQALEAARLVE